MKIAVIGATGKAGNLIAREALHRGHDVTAVVRDKARLPQGLFNVLEKEIFALTPDDVRGFDAVISAYGCKPGEEETQPDVMRKLISVFEQVPNVRLIAVGGAGSLYLDESHTKRLCDTLPPAAKLPIFMAKAFDILRESRVNWTFFSPALKFDFAGDRTQAYTLGGDHVIKNAGGESYISYADAAIALVDEAENNAHGMRRFTAVSEKGGATEVAGRLSHAAKRSADLAGRSLHLVMDDGDEYVADFTDAETLAWAKRGDTFADLGYQCVRATPHVYLICFFEAETCITLVADMKAGLVTMVKADVGVNPARPRLVSHRVVFGAIARDGEPLPVARQSYTTELAGKKIAWQYSKAVVKITHIYLNERYMRGSLKNMPPPAENATEREKAEIADRAARWSRLFFEEPCFQVKIAKNLYLVGMIEDFRNRVDPTTGGGDLVLLIDTALMRDTIRSFALKPGQAPEMRLTEATGEWVDEPDEMETAQSPYRIP